MNNLNPKVSWTIFIIFIVAFLGLVGYFAIYFNQDTLTTPSTSTTPTTTTDETANWKTYTDTKYNFSFKYPAAEYNLINKSPSEDHIKFESSTATTVESSKIAQYGFEVKVSKTDKTLSDLATGWLNTINDDGIFSFKATDATVAGQNAKKVENYWNALGAGRFSSCLFVYNGYKYEINAIGYSTDTTFVTTIFDNMLSTFKFTSSTSSSTSSTANWKTYRVTDLGISFKYPKEWGEAKLKSLEGMDSGESKIIIFSNKFSSEKALYSDVFAGYATPGSSAGREASKIEWGLKTKIYEMKNCDEVKQKYSFSKNCQFVKAKNGREGVIFYDDDYDSVSGWDYRAITGFYFSGKTDDPFLGIEERWREDMDVEKSLDIFKKIIESIE